MEARRVTFYRVYGFSAAHRLHAPWYDEMKNFEIYDKCNNISGHGHDYRVEVGVSGTPDARTGFIIDLVDMDKAVQSVLDKLDYKHLNKEVPYFRDRIATSEHLIGFLWQELEKALPAGKLYHIKLWETNNNYFEMERSATR
ncbi:MAG: 6-carboxytetrahydropterin synthase [Calditrichaeota bacterium]|nr:MAG: 6-carboxytetrahydropterin synthase [Calditrichota bacterium]